MQEPKFHLINDFGISKETIARNFVAVYGERDDPWSNRVRALLDKPTEWYTLDEIAYLIKALSSAHDDQVVENPDDFTDSQGRPSIEIWKSEKTLERQAELEERLRIFRARVENAASDGTAFRDVPPPQTVAVYDGNIVVPATPVQPQKRKPILSRESIQRPILVIIGLVTLAIVVLAFLIGIVITSSPGAPSTPPSSVADDGNWARIQAAGKITVGTAGDYPPFSYHGKNLALDGFDIQLMNEIGKRLGLQVVYLDIPFDGLAGALQVEQIDAAIAAISVTPEREGYVDFTNVYFVGEDGLVARQDSNISQIGSADDMAKLQVGVQRGSVYETWLTTSLVNTGKMPISNFFAYSQITQALDDLKANRLDVVVMDYLPAQDAVKQGGVKLVGHGLAKQNYAIEVRKGSLSLRNKLNQALTQMQMDGAVTKLAQQHLGVAPGPVSPTPRLTPVPAAPPPPCVDGLAFIQHLTLEDRNMTVFAPINPGQAFTKSWRIGNVGTCAWDSSYSVNFVQGNVEAARMGGGPAKIARVVQRGETYDLQIQLYAPIVPGAYQAWWEMRNAQGVALGQRLYLGIQVPPPATPTPPPTQTPAPGINFTADRTTLKAGEAVVLSWNVTNVKAVFLYVLGEPWERRGVSGQGSRQVYLQNTTVYELRVIKPDDQIETRQIRIDVTPVPNAPVIARFTVDPNFQILAGQCANLAWDVQGDVTKVTLTSNGAAVWDNAPVRGTLQNCPTGTGVVSYVIEATGPGGSNRAQRDVTLVAPLTPTPVPPPPGPAINAFAINPNAVIEQQCATLSWDVGGNVNSVRLFREDVVILDNAMPHGTAPECTTTPGTVTYRIEARNLTGQVSTREVILIVNPKPPTIVFTIENFVANAYDFDLGQTDPACVVLTWKISGSPPDLVRLTRNGLDQPKVLQGMSGASTDCINTPAQYQYTLWLEKTGVSPVQQSLSVNVRHGY
ncbi:L-cystine-binding protein FliY [Anaerolineae bacterium]|nr:L-cystine-binding protein FliY [Anaerolineae bacterium]